MCKVVINKLRVTNWKRNSVTFMETQVLLCFSKNRALFSILSSFKSNSVQYLIFSSWCLPLYNLIFFEIILWRVSPSGAGAPCLPSLPLAPGHAQQGKA
jgi:hypothetical protein